MVYIYLLFTANALLYLADMYVQNELYKTKLKLNLGSEMKFSLR